MKMCYDYAVRCFGRWIERFLFHFRDDYSQWHSERRGLLGVGVCKRRCTASAGPHFYTAWVKTSYFHISLFKNLFPTIFFSSHTQDVRQLRTKGIKTLSVECEWLHHSEQQYGQHGTSEWLYNGRIQQNSLVFPHWTHLLWWSWGLLLVFCSGLCDSSSSADGVWAVLLEGSGAEAVLHAKMAMLPRDERVHEGDAVRLQAHFVCIGVWHTAGQRENKLFYIYFHIVLHRVRSIIRLLKPLWSYSVQDDLSNSSNQ